MRDKVHLFVDASNFARRDNKTASLQRLLDARDSLVKYLDGRSHQIVLIADSNLYEFFKGEDLKKYRAMIARDEVIQAASGHVADIEVLSLAMKHDGHAVSKDGFRDHPKFTPWLDEPGKARLIGGLRDQVDSSWTFSERILAKNKNTYVEYRSFHEVLDDFYPTTKSVFRQLGLTTDQIREFSSALVLPNSDTDIISEVEAERIRVTVRQLLEYQKSVKSLVARTNVSERDCLHWLSLNGHFSLERDGSHYVSDDVALEVKAWLKSPFSTLLSFQLKKALERRDVVEVKRLINDLDYEGHSEMAALGRTSLVIFKSESEVNWTHFEELSPQLLGFLINSIVENDDISQLINAPAQVVEKFPTKYQALIHAERFLKTRSYDELVACLTITSQNISESETAVSRVSKIVLKEALSGSLVLPAKSWAVLADLFHASVHSAPVIDVCRYLAGRRFEAIATPFGHVKSVRDELRNRYVIEVLGVNWISSNDLGIFLDNHDLRGFLTSGDYSSFFSSPQVVEFIEKKIDELEGDETEGAQVAFSALVLEKIQPLLSVVQDAIDAMESVGR